MTDIPTILDRAADLFVHSGDCRMCAVGTATGQRDMLGGLLFTGDIVLSFVEGTPSYYLTVVVRDEYRSFVGGAHMPIDEPGAPYLMGIKSVPLEDTGEWRVLKVKDFSDVISGEHWRAFGFNYVAEPAASLAREMGR
jgi:hypothetical protein